MTSLLQRTTASFVGQTLAFALPFSSSPLSPPSPLFYNERMELNQPVADFALPDLDAHLHRLNDYRGQIVVINFWSAECPWCERTDAHLRALAHRHAGQMVLLSVAANANEPDDLLCQAAHQRGLPLVLRDPGGGVCDLFGAQTTPHAFVLGPGGILRYRGAVDDVTFRKRLPERWYVQEAVEALLAGQMPFVQETPPYGCAIVRETE